MDRKPTILESLDDVRLSHRLWLLYAENGWLLYDGR